MYNPYGGYYSNQNPYYGAPQSPMYPPQVAPQPSQQMPQAMPQAAPQPTVQPQAAMQPQQPQMGMNTNKIYANSAEDAEKMLFPYNSDYLILDNKRPILYRRTTDATGKPNVEEYDISLRRQEAVAPVPAPTPIDTTMFAKSEEVAPLRAEIDSLRKEVEQLRGKLNSRNNNQEGNRK